MKPRAKLWAAGMFAAAGTSIAGLSGYPAAFADSPDTPTLNLVASAPLTSILFRPCDSCVINSTPIGAHIGGTEIDTGTIHDERGRTVGHYSLQSIGVTPFTPSQSGELSQHAVIVLDSGQIVTEGLEEPPDNGGSAAVVGGTGRFGGARGVVKYTDQPDGSTLLQLFLRSN